MRSPKKAKKQKKASAPGIAIFCELSSDLKEKKVIAPETAIFSELSNDLRRKTRSSRK